MRNPVDSEAQDEMRRVQIGAIGIVAVLLLIGLASTLGARSNGSDQAPNAATTNAGPNAENATKTEPLVELGVQPASPKDEPKAAAQPNGTITGKPGSPNAAQLPPVILPPSQPVPVRADGSVPDLKPDPKAQKALQPN